MTDCVFCDELGRLGDMLVLRQNEFFVCKLDIHPVSPGHLLIIPKRHVARLCDLTPSEELQLRSMRNSLTTDRRVWPNYDELVATYQALRERRITENSLWFIDRALAHPRFGHHPDGFNHIVNEGAVAGQTVMHLHWHIIPRFRDDVRDPSGGGRYVIPEMGNYKEPRT